MEEAGSTKAMEERKGEAFAGAEQFTRIGKQLRPGEDAPNFSLDSLDLTVCTVGLADSATMVRLLSAVNSLQHPVCQTVTREGEALRATLLLDACISTVSMDSPQMQVDWQDMRACCSRSLCSLSWAVRPGLWRVAQEWRLLQRAVFVVDRANHTVYAEYIADQPSKPG
jgi:thioredoxin-dependent peroxiredoxin